jgi:hypothetical protein
LYVTAGEPLLVKGFQELLQKLVDAGYAKNVIVELDTNLTVMNPKITQLWSKFKRVNLRVSVDEVGPKYEVFRFPGKFSVLDRNLKALIGSRLSNMDILLTSCITPLNVFSIEDLEAYSHAAGVGRGMHFRFVDSPTRLDIRLLSPRKKDAILDYLNKARSSVWSPKVAAYIRSHYLQHSPRMEKEFVSFMDLMDSRRGHQWRNVFPRTFDLMSLE